MKQYLRQGLMVLIATGILVSVLLVNHFLIAAQNSRPMPNKAQEVQHTDVGVVNVSADQYEAMITSYGAANAHYELTLSAQVAGQIDVLNANFEPGKRIKKGTLLIRLEDSHYRAAVASAEHDLAAARLDLLEEERQVLQAEEEWKASGIEGEPASELVLRQPQLNAARTAVREAEATVKSAREDLSRTRIIAPFDALVVQRHVSPGSYVQAGSEIAMLYSTDHVEITVDLSARDWRSLPDLSALDQGEWPVELIDVEGGQHWTGRVLRAEQHLDDETRQRALVVAVDRPLDQTPALYPGSFLKAHVKGRLTSNLWALPSSALSQRGEIWYLTGVNTLANFPADPVFSDSQSIYIGVPEGLAGGVQRVVVHPLSSYLPGMRVNPIEQVNDNG